MGLMAQTQDYRSQIKNKPVISVTDLPYGAKGNGADDTVAVKAAITAACALTNASTVNGAKLSFPGTSSYYLITSTLTLCSYLEVEGLRAKIHYTGTGDLFKIPLSVDGSIHGLILEGTGIANTWGIDCFGTSGNGCLNEHIYDMRITGFGDTATHTGGSILNSADSGKMTINNSFLTSFGTSFKTTAATDALNLHDNYLADTGRCLDFTGETGATAISATHNNMVCQNGAGRVVGPGAYMFIGNEYESVGTMTNASSSAWEFLGSVDGPPIVKFYYNPTSIHGDATYCYYVDSGSTGPVYSDFMSNNCGGNFPVDATQYGFYNGDSSGTNRFSLNHMLQPTANLYKFPQASGVMYWPLSSNNLTDVSTILRYGAATSPTLDDATSGGTGSGTHTILVNVTNAGITGVVADTFKWNLDGGAYTTGVLMTGAAQTLSNGATVTFGATLGHSINTTWQINIVAGTVGPATLVGFVYLQKGDITEEPTLSGHTVKRLGAGTTSGAFWGYRIFRGDNLDASFEFETSSVGQAFAWVPNNTLVSGKIYPTEYDIGTGAGAIPVVSMVGTGLGLKVRPANNQIGVAVTVVTNGTVASVPIGSFAWCPTCTIASCVTAGTGAWVFHGAALSCPF